jgi:hypothetical protein
VSVEVARSWDPQDLLRRVRQSLDIAARTLDLLDASADPCPAGAAPAAGGCVPPAGAGRGPLIERKVVAETAMLLRGVAFLAASDHYIADATDTLARRLAPRARGDAMRVGLCLQPAAALDHAAAHIHLAALGHPDEAAERLLQDVLADRCAGAPERLPNHELEHHWLRQIASGAITDSPCDGTWLARTALALGLDALGSTTNDLYAFTHVVLHATDMGRRPVVWPRTLQSIECDARAGLAAALDADNLDLAAELLWTWPMAGLRWCPAAAQAFVLLARAQDARGFLPGPGYVDQEAAGLDGARREAYVLQTSYHASLVMGFLCAASLRPGRAPPAPCTQAAPSPLPVGSPTKLHEARASNPSTDLVDQVMSLLAPRPHPPTWERAWPWLAPAQRSALTDWVLTIVLRRAAASRDLPRLRAALALAVQTGLEAGPAMLQALALLRRATHLAGITSTDTKAPLTVAPNPA